MIRADEIRKGNGQIHFSLSVLETAHTSTETETKQCQPRPLVHHATKSISLAPGCLSDSYARCARLACCYGQL